MFKPSGRQLVHHCTRLRNVGVRHVPMAQEHPCRPPRAPGLECRGGRRSSSTCLSPRCTDDTLMPCEGHGSVDGPRGGTCLPRARCSENAVPRSIRLRRSWLCFTAVRSACPRTRARARHSQHAGIRAGQACAGTEARIIKKKGQSIGLIDTCTVHLRATRPVYPVNLWINLFCLSHLNSRMIS